MISGLSAWEHAHTYTLLHTHTLTVQRPKEAYRALLLKWSKLPGVKERLLPKKDRERRGRGEKQGEDLIITGVFLYKRLKV